MNTVADSGDEGAADGVDRREPRRPDEAPSAPAPAVERGHGAPDPDGDVTWLGLDLRRVSFREGWRIAPSWLQFFPLALVKLLRLRVPHPVAVPRELRWVDRAHSVPTWAAVLLAREESALIGAGLSPVLTYSARSLGAGAPDVIARVFLAADGRSLTQLMAMPSLGSVAAHLEVTCTSLTRDGVLVDTTTARMLLDHPRDSLVEVMRGDATAVVRRHDERIAGLSLVTCAAEDVPGRLAEEHARALATHEGRGVYVPLTPAQVAALRAGRGEAEPRRRWSKLGSLAMWAALVAVLWWLVTGGGGARRAPGPHAPGPVEETHRRVEKPKATDAQLAAALAPFRERLAASSRPVARVSLAPLEVDDVRASKVGGEPYLPAGEAPPRSADGRSMVLLAQINFAEVPPMEGYPEAGLLQFFIARDSDGAPYGMDLTDRSPDTLMAQRWFRVRYLDHLEAEVVGGRAVPRCRGRCATPHDPDRPRRMSFTLGQEPISPADVNFASVVGFEPSAWVLERAAAWQVDESDLAERALPTASGHKLGGYPHFTQVDPRLEGTPLRLLLQLDSDDELMWGDAGVGAFFIDPADLARRDFSRVLYSWDCY